MWNKIQGSYFDLKNLNYDGMKQAYALLIFYGMVIAYLRVNQRKNTEWRHTKFMGNSQ